MRTTIDLPDHLFRRTKVLAAARGMSMKDLVVHAIECEVIAERSGAAVPIPRRAKFPLIHLRSGRKLDLSRFNFDDLLA